MLLLAEGNGLRRAGSRRQSQRRKQRPLTVTVTPQSSSQAQVQQVLQLQQQMRPHQWRSADRRCESAGDTVGSHARLCDLWRPSATSLAISTAQEPCIFLTWQHLPGVSSVSEAVALFAFRKPAARAGSVQNDQRVVPATTDLRGSVMGARAQPDREQGLPLRRRCLTAAGSTDSRRCCCRTNTTITATITITTAAIAAQPTLSAGPAADAVAPLAPAGPARGLRGVGQARRPQRHAAERQQGVAGAPCHLVL